MRRTGPLRAMLLGAVALAVGGCIADYRIQSPHVSILLAQGDGPDLHRTVRRSRRLPIVARHDWDLFTRNQVEKVLQQFGTQKGAVILVGEHLKNIFTMGAQRALMGPDASIPWLAFKVRIYPDVTE